MLVKLIDYAHATPAADNAFRLSIKSIDGASSVGALIGKLFQIIGLAAGIAAFFFLVYSGFSYLTAGGNAEQAKKAQQGIINAAIGIIIIVLAYAIFTALRGTANSIN